MSAELESAYRRTRYEVPGLGLCLRIGQPSPALDAVLRHFGAEAWAFVSAANPLSRPLVDRCNARRHARLRARVEALGLLAFEGYGIADARDWPPETSLLVLGIAADEVRDLGRRFGQHAVVVGRRGGVPRLLWCQAG